MIFGKKIKNENTHHLRKLLMSNKMVNHWQIVKKVRNVDWNTINNSNYK
jgi:hypothetical protein